MHDYYTYKYGDLRVRLFKVLAVVFVVALVGGAVMFVRAKRERATIITPAQSVAEGCCIARVKVKDSELRDYSASYIANDTYEVLTHAGRRPQETTGQVSSAGTVQVYVGKEWIGRVRIISSCRGGTKTGVTDTIGDPSEPLPWKEREVTMREDC